MPCSCITTGFTVSAVNPLFIKEYGGNSLRKVKTDKADSIKIARYALDNWDELRQYTINSIQFNSFMHQHHAADRATGAGAQKSPYVMPFDLHCALQNAWNLFWRYRVTPLCSTRDIFPYPVQ